MTRLTVENVASKLCGSLLFLGGLGLGYVNFAAGWTPPLTITVYIVASAMVLIGFLVFLKAYRMATEALMEVLLGGFH